MELGITPIITSGMILQLIVGLKVLDLDMNKSRDRGLFNAAQKLLGILINLGSSLAYVLAGSYGPVSELGLGVSLALIAQLFFAGMLMIMLDDLLGKGWGLGGGINLFIVTNICESVLWALFSPLTISTGAGTLQFEGAIVNAFHQIIMERNKFKALTNIFFRPDLPNLMSVIATVAVFLIVIYIQGWTNKSTMLVPRDEALRGRYPPQPLPIKLFYTSNMPIILLSALISQVYFFSQVLYRRYGANPLIRLLGIWDESTRRPVWGIAYILSPPSSLMEVWEEPFHALFYITFYLTSCALFAQIWLQISGSGPSTVLKQLNDVPNGPLVVRNATGDKVLETRRIVTRKIETAAALGGLCVAALSISADLLGAIGSGTGILMAVTLIYDLFEKINKEGGFKELFDNLRKQAAQYK